MRVSVRVLLLLCTVAVGCDSPAPVVQDEKKADPQADAEAKARIEERRKAREAEAKAAEEAKAKKAAAFDAACTAPADTPKKLQAACELVSEAWDGFMQRKYKDEPDVLAKWNESKGSQLVFSMTQCKKQGSIEVGRG